MRNTNYNKYGKVVCINWSGSKFKIGGVYGLTSELKVYNHISGYISIFAVNTYHSEFRKAYKNELKIKG